MSNYKEEKRIRKVKGLFFVLIPLFVAIYFLNKFNMLKDVLIALLVVVLVYIFFYGLWILLEDRE